MRSSNCPAQPDVVILDIIMPKHDGHGVLEKVRSMGLRKRRRTSLSPPWQL
jgi:CheY-like chemotaxis protein